METFSIGNRTRETYQVKLEHSLLWEAALGIAAITNDRLIDTLTLSENYWKEVRSTFSESLQYELKKVKTHNTWKTLLQLLHETDSKDLPSWKHFISNLEETELIKLSIPYLGRSMENVREAAASGSTEAVKHLMDQSRENPFYPEYIEYICTVDIEKLKDHLILIMEEWWKAVIVPIEGQLQTFLERDIQAKRQMALRMEAEDFVEWATNGISYQPEPSVYEVLLIPHYVYRPWNIEADLAGVKVFYYPVAQESIKPNEEGKPGEILVQRYKALADENRLYILKLLYRREMSLKELSKILDMGKTTVYHHLKLLKAARLVSQKGVYYQTNPAVMKSVSKELETYMQTE